LAELKVYLLYLAIAFVLAVGLLWSFSQTARLGYRIGELTQEIARLQSENEKLAYELSGLASIARIEEEATGELGMVRPGHIRVGPPGDAAAETSFPADAGRDAAVIIRLDSPEAASEPGELASVDTAPERGFIGSLWDRVYQWLTGVSQAEASDWN